MLGGIFGPMPVGFLPALSRGSLNFGFPLPFMVYELAHFRELEVVENVVAVVVEDPQVVGLVHIAHHHVEVISIFLLHLIQRDLTGDELFEPFNCQFLY